MTRTLVLLIVAWLFSWLLLQFNVLPAQASWMLASLVYGVAGIVCPVAILMLLFAPGAYRELLHETRHVWARMGLQRREIEELKHKIAHLNRAHHMVQLGALYARQGRPAQAVAWYEQAVEKEPDSLEARYGLALCRFSLRDYAAASELLEQIHQEKPSHDYGTACLRLAEAQQRRGNSSRAREVYEHFLRFYPNHAEGSYQFALLLEQSGEIARASELMRELIVAVRHSPNFQRRRNRHWALKARWWLWRHGSNG